MRYPGRTHSIFSVAVAYSNQKKIDAEAKQLQTNAATFARQTTQWLKLMEDFSGAMKVGQFSIWSLGGAMKVGQFSIWTSMVL